MSAGYEPKHAGAEVAGPQAYEPKHARPGDRWVYDMARMEQRMGFRVVPLEGVL